MRRIRFFNKYRKHRKYRQQQNSPLRKSKKEYYSGVNVWNIIDNKNNNVFKNNKTISSSQEVTLIDNEEIVKNDDEAARVLNTFLSNIVSSLKILDYSNCDPLVENIQEPVLTAIVKHENHLSIFTLGEVPKKNPQFFYLY